MEAYLQGQDLWELASSTEQEPGNMPLNVESHRKWKIKCGKGLFALRTTINKEYIDHVRDETFSKNVWDVLEKIFTRKNTTRLQFLENELAMAVHGGMSVAEYFLRVKGLWAKISELDATEKISEARLRRFHIRGLKKEYTPFIIYIQGWVTQPTVEELENLFSNQEILAKQMAKESSEHDVVIFLKGKSITSNFEEEKKYMNNGAQGSKPFKCYRCGKTWHIKRYYRAKISKSNVACEDEDDDQPRWEKCFTTEVSLNGQMMVF